MLAHCRAIAHCTDSQCKMHNCTWHLALTLHQLLMEELPAGISKAWTWCKCTLIHTLAHFLRCTWPELPAAGGSGSPSQLALGTSGRAAAAIRAQRTPECGTSRQLLISFCSLPPLRLYAPPPCSETKYSKQRNTLHMSFNPDSRSLNLDRREFFTRQLVSKSCV